MANERDDNTLSYDSKTRSKRLSKNTCERAALRSLRLLNARLVPLVLSLQIARRHLLDRAMQRKRSSASAEHPLNSLH